MKTKKNKLSENKSLIKIENAEHLPVKALDISEKQLVSYYPTKSDAYSNYIQEIKRYKLLSPEQEAALVKALLDTGDVEVAKRLVMANLRLVVKIAIEYQHAWKNIMDLIQEGNLGLMKAVSKYDPTKGAKLSYYASWWIKSYILKYILDNFRLVKIGTTNDQKKLFYNLMKEKNRLVSIGINPDNKTISENLGVSEKAVMEMSTRLLNGNDEISVDKPLSSENDSVTTILDLMPSNEGNIEDNLANKQEVELLRENLVNFMSNLKERDKEIFENRLLCDVPKTLQEIADNYGVTRERIRQIEARLIKNLRVYMSEYIR